MESAFALLVSGALVGGLIYATRALIRRRELRVGDARTNRPLASSLFCGFLLVWFTTMTEGSGMSSQPAAGAVGLLASLWTGLWWWGLSKQERRREAPGG